MELSRELLSEMSIAMNRYSTLIKDLNDTALTVFEHVQSMFDIFKKVKKSCPYCRHQTRNPDWCGHKDVRATFKLCRFDLGEYNCNLPKIHCPLFKNLKKKI